MGRQKVYGMTFEQAVDEVEGDPMAQERQGEGMNVTMTSSSFLHVVYTEDGPQWVIGGDKVIGRDG